MGTSVERAPKGKLYDWTEATVNRMQSMIGNRLEYFYDDYNHSDLPIVFCKSNETKQPPVRDKRIEQRQAGRGMRDLTVTERQELEADLRGGLPKEDIIKKYGVSRENLRWLAERIGVAWGDKANGPDPQRNHCINMLISGMKVMQVSNQTGVPYYLVNRWYVQLRKKGILPVNP